MSGETIRDRIQRVKAARDAEIAAKRVEPKWGKARRQAIMSAMCGKKAFTTTRYDVLRFTRQDRGATDMSHFFDKIASEEDMRHVEKLLGL